MKIDVEKLVTLGCSGQRKSKYQPKRKVVFVPSSGEEIDDSQPERNEPQPEEMTYQFVNQVKGKAKVASSPRDIPESSKNAELREIGRASCRERVYVLV